MVKYNYPNILSYINYFTIKKPLPDTITTINNIFHFHSNSPIKFIEQMLKDNLAGDYTININNLSEIINKYNGESPQEQTVIVNSIAKEFYKNNENNEKKSSVLLYELLLDRIKNIEGVTLTKGGRKTLKALLKTFLYNVEIKKPQLIGTASLTLDIDTTRYGNPIAMNVNTHDWTIFFNQHLESGSVYWYYSTLDENIQVGSLVAVEGSPLPRLVISTDKSIAYPNIQKKIESVENTSHVDSFKDIILIDDKKAYTIQTLLMYNKMNSNNKIDPNMLLKILG